MGRTIKGVEDMESMARELIDIGPKAVLLKGGHMEGSVVKDMLITKDGIHVYENERIVTAHTHGTGCTLASSIAAGIANGLPIENAVAQAEKFLHKAIESAPGFGSGHGPINHLHLVRAI